MSDQIEIFNELNSTEPTNHIANLTSDHLQGSVSPESIVVFGATGLVGSRIVKALSRSIKSYQTIYAFSRDIYRHDRPQVVIKYCDPGSWVEELQKLKNITAVYCALGAKRLHRFWDFNTYEEFYKVNHNLFFQIATCAKDVGVPTFVMISGFDAGYIAPKFYRRKTIARASAEKDITSLGFKNLIIMRPGPLAGIREKRASLKMFSLWSCIEGVTYIAASPLLFVNPLTPGLTPNFGTSVGKAAVYSVSKVSELPPVSTVGHFGIVKGAWEYNRGIYTAAYKKIVEISAMSIPETATKDETEAIFENFSTNITSLVQVILGEKFSIDGKSLVHSM